MTRCVRSLPPVLLLVVTAACAPWAPTPGTTWQWQLTGEIDTSLDVAMYDIDMLAPDVEDVPALIASLQESRRVVVCYFSAGTWESFRSDAPPVPGDAVGAELEDWPDEYWLDVRRDEVKDYVRARLDQASIMGCDGVEPDNVDAYANASGFDISPEEQLEFNRYIAEIAHERKLSVGLKNDVEQIPDLVDDFDWALNEECLVYGECAAYLPFLDANKAVFHVEYVDDPAAGQPLADEVCPRPTREGFSTLIKTYDLDAFAIACDE